MAGVDGSTGPSAARYCARLTRTRAKNFAYAFLLLPGRERRAMHALYAYCRLCDDIADARAAPLDERRAALARVREALGPALDGVPAGPVLGELARAVRRYGIARADLVAIVDGVATDLEPTVAIADFEALRGYCYGVASAVGLAAIEVFGHRGGRAREYAESLGLALQLTNILRDVAEDAANGRVYLPADWMATHGCDAASILAGAPAGDVGGLLTRLAREAREHFAAGRRLLPLVRESTRACPATLAGLYEALLDRIEARGVERAMVERVRLAGREKMAIAAGCWVRSRLAFGPAALARGA